MTQALRLLQRAGCGLCDEMHAELAQLASEHPLPPLSLLDVDDDPELRRRYGLKVPVLMLGDDLVCFGRLDRAELLRLLAPRAGEVPAGHAILSRSDAAHTQLFDHRACRPRKIDPR